MQIKINKRSTYAPIRYEATRPYAVSLGKAYLAESARGDQARLKFVQGKLLELLKTSTSKIGHERGPGPLQAEMVNVQVFGSFVGAGKIIYDVSKVLTQALAHMDAEDIPCGELEFPASSFYLHFGLNSGLVDDGFEIEGAFVTHYGDRMAIDLVQRGFGQQHFLALPMGDAMTGARIMLNDPAMPVMQALDAGIADVLDKNRAIFEQMAQFERQLEQQYGQVVKVPVHVERLAEKGPLLRRALALIVNCMFYLAAEPEDVQEDWEPATPVEALQKLSLATKPSEAKNLECILHNARYTKVRFVGRRFSQSVSGQQIQTAQEGGRRQMAHFRRGHFRRQPYGPERALRKTIFVAPVMVNADHGGEPQGRIYVVVSPESP